MTSRDLPDLAPALHPGAAIAIRPGRRVQIGAHPGREVIVDLPGSIDSHAFLRLLEDLCVPRTRIEAYRVAAAVGLTPADVDDLLDVLTTTGHAHPATPTPRSLRIRLHGRGPVTTALHALLRDAGVQVERSTQRPRTHRDGHRSLHGWDCDLVILTDHLVHDPLVVEAMIRDGIPHLPARVCDGVGVVGPLVLPGLSSCLRCDELHRADHDHDWPVVTAQWVGRSSWAPASVIAMVAAVAFDQVAQIRQGLADTSAGVPQCVDRAVEIGPRPSRMRVRHMSAHPLCPCTGERPSGSAFTVGR
ncbi:hypothetical protein [Williamsia sterculiae]|uniref:Bacteriocin biosynthesis cyclodehydratase domain-containing protein n=1 Tax=Williamsia sterculiae TaxID=1344003 RepID=A0A1N7FXR7_9NOCA|nr:hypothetical protein [Williamsia sterculiae]SIS05148.1 hypothetical protein SAMN05445060_2394 [Williamsia sterculiae]